MQEVHIYTSISSKSPKVLCRRGLYRIEVNTAKGIKFKEDEIQITGTANQAELLVLGAALNELNKKCLVVIHTDSAYVAAGFNQGRVITWMKNGWKTSKGEPVANRKEWLEVLKILCKVPFKVILNGEK